VTLEPDELLADAAVQAAVGALAARNSHHLDSMDDEERVQALRHWQELATDVLTAARASLTGGETPKGPPVEALPGRAVIVLQDAGGDDVTVHATFHPELQDLGNGEIGGTPAQITAVMLLETLGGEGEDGEQPPMV
jgi:hypothetical protein